MPPRWRVKRHYLAHLWHPIIFVFWFVWFLFVEVTARSLCEQSTFFLGFTVLGCCVALIGGYQLTNKIPILAVLRPKGATDLIYAVLESKNHAYSTFFASAERRYVTEEKMSVFQDKLQCVEQYFQKVQGLHNRWQSAFWDCSVKYGKLKCRGK